MIGSNYPSNLSNDLDLMPPSLFYTSLLDGLTTITENTDLHSPSMGLTSHLVGQYDYYGDYENQINFNNVTPIQASSYPDLAHDDCNQMREDHFFKDLGLGGYGLANLNHPHQPSLVDDYPIPCSSTSPLASFEQLKSSNGNHRYSSASSVSSHSCYSSSTSEYTSSIVSDTRPQSTTSIESIEVNRSIDGCKRDLIKATLNFAIKSRRKSLGLSEIDLVPAKVQEPRPASWTNEDDEKKMSRRERNRIAARKCRKNRKLKYIGLNKTMENLDTANHTLKEQLTKLKRESEQLEDMLTSHQSSCYLVSSWPSQPPLDSFNNNITSSPSVSSSSPSPVQLQFPSQATQQPLPTSGPSKVNTNSPPIESHGFISYINQSQSWFNALQ